ncbi:hypothetical protein EMPS_00888 [Entomortierella parvispora]|uniref:Uncharacterized protein n=1 Tax=Entomortierella parvispora TaxID=205924 RepID=A0A9P3LSA4_9FUNG|nr:hypothetical protein EMPS_00888 [Entomortierella parvispora]
MATINPTGVDSIMSDGGIGPPTSSRALFIAEILAGAAAALLVVAVICCLCSGAARKRTTQLERDGQGATLTYVDGILETGRQTPDVAPAYSTSSPLGPISPEVIDALSRVSIECRQSFVASILSSNSLQQQLAEGTHSSSQISMVSSLAENYESPHLHTHPHAFAPVGVISNSTSPRSSRVSSQYGEIQYGNNNISNNNNNSNSDPFGSAGSEAGTTGQDREGGGQGGDGGQGEEGAGAGEESAASPLTLSSLSPSSPSNIPSATALLQHLQHLQHEPPPPSYDPSWRTALILPNHDPSYSRRLHWLRNQNMSRSNSRGSGNGHGNGHGAGSGGGGDRPLARHSSESYTRSYTRDGYLTPPHRRTESVSAPIIRQRTQDPHPLQRASTQLRTRAQSNNMDRGGPADPRWLPPPQQQQYPPSSSQPHPQPHMPPLQRLGSRRSISWTGSPIRFTLTSPTSSAVGTTAGGASQDAPHSRNPSRTTFRSLIQRSPLSSSVTAHHTTTTAVAAVAAAAMTDPGTSDSEESTGVASSVSRSYNPTQQPPLGPPPSLQPIRNLHPRPPGTEHVSLFGTDSTAETRVEMVEPLPDSPLSH